VVGALAVPATASAITYAPVDQPGPPLSVPQGQLDAALQCRGNLAAGETPVLLVHGTGSNPEHNFSWNWGPALTDLGHPWCAAALPDNGMDDVQVAAEYVVHAIRKMHAQAGRKISIIGHSQGGMIPRWPLRFWPDTREMVDDQIGFAPSNHGTQSARAACAVGCPAAHWQQRDDSQFIAALNSYQETFPGISYTAIYTHLDVIVTPNLDETGSSSLRGGGGQITNIAVQDVCPTDLSDHLAIGTIDNTAYTLAIDALEHPGPADPARIPTGVCAQPLMPGVNPATVATDMAAAAADLLVNTESAPAVPAEPPLKCYVTASCPQPAVAAKAKAKCKKKKGKKRRRHADAAKKKPKKCKKRMKKR
jgi:pimeloyl-ACP methyl ester carboxylesterase